MKPARVRYLGVVVATGEPGARIQAYHNAADACLSVTTSEWGGARAHRAGRRANPGRFAWT